MLYTIIERQIPLGSKVKFILKSEGELSGILIELGPNHITVEQDGKPATILLEMIGAWEVLSDGTGEKGQKQDDNILVNDEADDEVKAQNASLQIKDNINEPDTLVQSSPDNFDDKETPYLTNSEKGEVAVPSQITASDIDVQNTRAQSKDGLDDVVGVSPSPTDESDDADILPQVIEVNSIEDTQPSEESSLAVSQRLNEIISNIQTKLQTIELEVTAPDFNPPYDEFEGYPKDLTGIWNRIRDIYNNAVKINELDPKYGRIQRIVKSLEDLVRQYTKLPTTKRYLGYFYWLLDDVQKSTNWYKQAANNSFSPSDSYDLAVIAIKNNQHEIACDNFKQFFRRSGCIKDSDIWCVYVNICCNLKNFAFLTNWLELGENCFIEDSLDSFFEVGIYSLSVLNKESVALELISRYQEEESIEVLVNETYKKLIEEIAPSLIIEHRRFNGQIYSYRVNEEFGFLRDESGTEYFFDISEIHEYTLIHELRGSELQHPLPVSFEAISTPKGPRAIRISRGKGIILTEDVVTFESTKSQRLNGQIYSYIEHRRFGFLRDDVGIEYYFSVEEVHGDDLRFELQDLRSYGTLSVSFEPTKTPKGPRAIQINRKKDSIAKPQSREFSQKLQGEIYSYKSYNTYGFLRTKNGQEYFFHRSAVVDDNLLEKLDDWVWGARIPIFFEAGRGARGKQNPLAIRLSLYRDLNDLYKMALGRADEGEYRLAVEKIEEILYYDPEYPSAQELYQKWLGYSQISNIPKGNNVYARAKRAQIVEKDFDKAENLFLEAIQEKDNAHNAVRDLTLLYARLSEKQKAIDFLRNNRKQIRDQRLVDNLLINLYQEANQYDQAITLLQGQIKNSPKKKKLSLLSQIADIYLEQGNYSEAEDQFRKILRQKSNDISLERKLAVSLIRQERFVEAEGTLNSILERSSDVQTRELLETIEKVKKTGQSATSILIETTLSDFSTQLSGFTRFLLARNEFDGVQPEHIKNKRFTPSDIKNLENLATQLGTRRPKDRSAYYLSAARIISILDENDDPNQFYKYLGRGFASRGDAAVGQTKPLEVVREFYSEALNAYDHVRTKRVEQDAFNALVRYLFSILGHSRIPITPEIPSVQDAIKTVFDDHPNPSVIFDSIAYLVLQSRFAADQILRRLYQNTNYQDLTISYLRSQNLTSDFIISDFDNFIRLWNELRINKFNETEKTLNELGLLRRIEFTTSSLENSILRIKSLDFYFDLDRQRVQKLLQAFQFALDLLKEGSFDEKERLCNLIDDQCKVMLNEIEENPTRLSAEHLYPIIEIVKKKSDVYLQGLYRSSIPQLTLRLAVETYAPENNRNLDVQIAIENKSGCSPADSLELIVIVQEDEATFELRKPEIKLDSSLRGGEQQILQVPIKLTKDAISSKSFSMSMYAQYRTRLGGISETTVTDFSIRLHSEDEFEQIKNPYAAYAEGGPVADLDMFYGRQELIDNAAQAVESSPNQAKSIVIFGQKRAGKSSILYHLKNKLQEKSGFLILDLGNIGSIIDPNSKIPFLYQILWGILNQLGYAIEDKIDEGFSDLGLSIPDSMEFYQHPTPLMVFNEVFDHYKRKKAKSNSWSQLQTVLLIDEFSYIYGQIVDGLIPESFMKNWKALLQKNYFSAVLAGQDVMPKFKQQFPNEFGTSQDERVSYLMPEDAKKLIDEPIRIGDRSGESRYREQAIERILALTAGSPFYIQIFCNRLVDYMNRHKAIYITEANVEHVKDELISGVNALGKDKFENLFNSGDTSQDAISDDDTLKVLTDIALHSQTGPCNLNNITCKTEKPIDTILNDLVNREVVERSRGQYYQIRVQLFEEWLVTNRQE